MSQIDDVLGEIDAPISQSSSGAKPKKLGYVQKEGQITLSFSRLKTLRTCPRKFLLKELNQKTPSMATIDTAYGSAFGAGVQAMFQYDNLERAWLAALAEWDFEDFTSHFRNKKEKSLWSCMAQLEAFWQVEYPAISAEYELAYVEGREGIELFIFMSCGESYNYQVHIDLVLQNRETKGLVVAEIKTSTAQQHEANWGNADQTLGYYAILEFISKKYNLPFEPRVIYITAQAGKYLDMQDNYGFTTFVYEKPLEISLDFARNVVLDIETIELYIDHNYFPKRGSACFSFYRPCEFYGICDLENLQDSGEAEHGQVYDSLSMDDVDFTFDLQDLIKKL